jgi:hypothetical protein
MSTHISSRRRRSAGDRSFAGRRTGGFRAAVAATVLGVVLVTPTGGAEATAHSVTTGKGAIAAKPCPRGSVTSRSGSCARVPSVARHLPRISGSPEAARRRPASRMLRQRALARTSSNLEQSRPPVGPFWDAYYKRWYAVWFYDELGDWDIRIASVEIYRFWNGSYYQYWFTRKCSSWNACWTYV